jgi:hypothetical protein
MDMDESRTTVSGQRWGDAPPPAPPLPPMLGCWFMARGVEREFWSSDYCRRKLMKMERWGVVSVILMIAQQAVLGHPRKLLSIPRVHYFNTLTGMLVVLMRAVLSLFLPDVFWRNRQVVHCQRETPRP